MPASEVFAELRITALLAHWSHRDAPQSDDTVTIMGGDWLRALSGYPAWALALAADEWLDRNRYKPQIADIRALADAAVREDRLTLRLLRLLVGGQNGIGSIGRIE